MSDYTVDQLVAVGGSEWTGGQNHRVYFNNAAALYGLKVSFYGSGNISAATLDGEHISNGSARGILSTIEGSRFHYDVNTGRFAAKGLNRDAMERIETGIAQRVAALAVA